MIKPSGYIAVALFLAVGPASGQMHSGAASGRVSMPMGAAARASVASSSELPGLPSTPISLSGPAALVVAHIETAAANPESLRALASDRSPAAVYARSLISSRDTTPAARADAVKALGEGEVVRIEAAVATLAAQAEVSQQTSASLESIAADLKALSGGTDQGTMAPEHVSGPALRGARARVERVSRARDLVRVIFDEVGEKTDRLVPPDGRVPAAEYKLQIIFVGEKIEHALAVAVESHDVAVLELALKYLEAEAVKGKGEDRIRWFQPNWNWQEPTRMHKAFRKWLLEEKILPLTTLIEKLRPASGR